MRNDSFNTSLYTWVALWISFLTGAANGTPVAFITVTALLAATVTALLHARTLWARAAIAPAVAFAPVAIALFAGRLLPAALGVLLALFVAFTAPVFVHLGVQVQRSRRLRAVPWLPRIARGALLLVALAILGSVAALHVRDLRVELWLAILGAVLGALVLTAPTPCRRALRRLSLAVAARIDEHGVLRPERGGPVPSPRPWQGPVSAILRSAPRGQTYRDDAALELVDVIQGTPDEIRKAAAEDDTALAALALTLLAMGTAPLVAAWLA